MSEKITRRYDRMKIRKNEIMSENIAKKYQKNIFKKYDRKRNRNIRKKYQIIYQENIKI